VVVGGAVVVVGGSVVVVASVVVGASVVVVGGSVDSGGLVVAGTVVTGVTVVSTTGAVDEVTTASCAASSSSLQPDATSAPAVRHSSTRRLPFEQPTSTTLLGPSAGGGQ
jgi:hypothetical protein